MLIGRLWCWLVRLENVGQSLVVSLRLRRLVHLVDLFLRGSETIFVARAAF